MGPARRQCYKVIRFEKSMFFVIFNTPLKSVSFKKPVEISWVLEISTGFLKETDFRLAVRYCHMYCQFG